jgi:regulatory protein
MARQARRVTPEYLEKAALHYLERFATSGANLRRVLLRKVERSAREHETDRAEAAGWVEALLARLEKQGLLNDRLYAEGRVASLRRRGDSARTVRNKLAQKGVAAPLVEDLLGREEEGSEFAAAVALARRRRLGPWRPEDKRTEMRDKDLATLARAGFSWDTVRRIVEAPTPEDLEEDR